MTAKSKAKAKGAARAAMYAASVHKLDRRGVVGGAPQSGIRTDEVPLNRAARRAAARTARGAAAK